MTALPQGGFARIAVHEASHAVAAITYGIPIIGIDITAKTPHLLRGRYRPPASIALESMCVLCLSGPAGEEYLCGRIDDGGDEADYAMCREYLSRVCDPVMVGAGITRVRDAADRLVRTDWVERRIRVIAAALLQQGTLSGVEICELSR